MKISVCIATHNGSNYIVEQLLSVLEQLDVQDEIIISDDGSGDNTIELVKSIGDSRIKIHSYSHKKDYTRKKLSSYYYASANFINALRYASGDYIFLADQDDRWKNNKVKECMAALQKADIVSHNFAVMDSRGKILEPKFLKDFSNEKFNLLKILVSLPFRGCCLAFKKEILLRIFPTPKDIFLHDCYIGLFSVLHRYKFSYVDKCLIDYRRHDTNVSDLESPNSLWFKLAYRVKMLWQIFTHWH